VDVLLVTGSKAPHLHTVHTTAQKLNKKRTTLLVVDDVADVLTEAVRSPSMTEKFFFSSLIISHEP